MISSDPRKNITAADPSCSSIVDHKCKHFSGSYADIKASIPFVDDTEDYRMSSALVLEYRVQNPERIHCTILIKSRDLQQDDMRIVSWSMSTSCVTLIPWKNMIAIAKWHLRRHLRCQQDSYCSSQISAADSQERRRSHHETVANFDFRHLR